MNKITNLSLCIFFCREINSGQSGWSLRWAKGWWSHNSGERYQHSRFESRRCGESNQRVWLTRSSHHRQSKRSDAIEFSSFANNQHKQQFKWPVLWASQQRARFHHKWQFKRRRLSIEQSLDWIDYTLSPAFYSSNFTCSSFYKQNYLTKNRICRQIFGSNEQMTRNILKILHKKTEKKNYKSNQMILRNENKTKFWKKKQNMEQDAFFKFLKLNGKKNHNLKIK